MKRLLKILVPALILGLALFWLLSQPRDYLSEPLSREKPLLDTLVTIKAYGVSRSRTEEAVNQAFAAMAKIEAITNNFDNRSEITRLNRSSGQGPVKVSRDLFQMIALSLYYSKKTNGAFDITVGPLTGLWQFGEKKRVPRADEINRMLPLVGWKMVSLDRREQTITLQKPGMSLDPGGVSKGYAVDAAVQVLQAYGVKQALVTTGSTTRVMGGKPKSAAWRIGIQHPREPQKLLGIVPLMQKSISTSGDYQRYFIKGGRRYHHILNPGTGYPVDGVMAVTVITARSCAAADILSTGIFALGYPEGMRFVEREKDLAAIMVTSDGRIHVSSRLKGKVVDLMKNVIE